MYTFIIHSCAGVFVCVSKQIACVYERRLSTSNIFKNNIEYYHMHNTKICTVNMGVAVFVPSHFGIIISPEKKLKSSFTSWAWCQHATQ